MKVKELILRNYKGFGNSPVSVNFCDLENNPNEVTVLIGKNATGKSTILQSIASVVAASVQPRKYPSSLNWPGFDYRYLESGPFTPEVTVKLQFNAVEINATREYAEKIKERIPSFVTPGKAKEVSLFLEYFNDRVISSNVGAFNQTKGYQYALQLPSIERTEALSKVGNIFWYTEQRTFSSILAKLSTEDGKTSSNPDVDVRTILGKWSNFHFRPLHSKIEGQIDRFAQMNNLFGEIFPGRKIEGVAPKRRPEDQLEPEDIWFADTVRNTVYELSNMSAGERSIFPVLFDFVNWNIHNSIILIDEIELHLHPPLQVAFLKLLPKLGKNNQFIITTHSPHILNSVSPHQVRVVRDFSVEPLNHFTEGRDVNSILRDVLGLEERPEEYSKKLSRFYGLLEIESIKEARVAFEELEKNWGTSDTEVVRARFFLEDLEADLQKSEEISG